MRPRDRFGRPRRRRWLRWVLVAALAALGLHQAARLRVGSLVRRGGEDLIAGKLEDAGRHFRAAQGYRVRQGSVLEALGLADLLAGRGEDAEPRLSRARTAGVRRPILDPDRLAARLADEARYAEIVTYAAHRREAGGPQISPLWTGEAALAQGRLIAAASDLEAAVKGGPAPERAEKLRKLLLRRRAAAGLAEFVYDRRGRPLYATRPGEAAGVLHAPEMEPAFTGPGGILERLEPRDREGRVTLTLDLAVQKAAEMALGRYTGAFVAVEPSTGAVLALVSHDGGRPGLVPAYRRPFEPGSIVKMITLAATLEAGLDQAAFYPLPCAGNTTLDGRSFYDWTAHGTVDDHAEATAVSCNLAFGAMALELGQVRLDESLARFGFGLQIPDSEGKLDLGQLSALDGSAPRHALASRGVGLANLTVTPVHLALIAAALANDGIMMRPHLIAARSGLGSETPYAAATLQPLSQATLAPVAAQVEEAMRQVVLSEEGTGRRARLAGLDFVMKTGTAGDRDPGLNTVIIGYAPRDSPRLAFGFVAEHAGKAELEGARIVRDFLTTVRGELERAP